MSIACLKGFFLKKRRESLTKITDKSPTMDEKSVSLKVNSLGANNRTQSDKIFIDLMMMQRRSRQIAAVAAAATAATAVAAVAALKQIVNSLCDFKPNMNTPFD